MTIAHSGNKKLKLVLNESLLLAHKLDTLHFEINLDSGEKETVIIHFDEEGKEFSSNFTEKKHKKDPLELTLHNWDSNSSVFTKEPFQLHNDDGIDFLLQIRTSSNKNEDSQRLFHISLWEVL